MTDVRLPEAITEGPLAGAHRWRFEVAEIVELTSAIRRLRLTADHLELLAPAPGQDLMLQVPTDDGATVNRRYSIRAHDPVGRRVDVDVVLHGDGPGARWAARAVVGDVIEAVGPRGKVLLAEGIGRHLFVGDAAGAPAMLSMLEGVPAGAEGHALLVVGDRSEVQPTTAPDDRVTWLVSTDPAAVAERLAVLAADADHVYLAGERGDVAAQRAQVLALGFAPERVSAKAYWSRGAPNAPHGEPARTP